ncbi:MAG: cAMP-binding protein [Pseudooceanicola sp.]|nr:cAMP-binding protein [Pseudooceanicola sp.]
MISIMSDWQTIFDGAPVMTFGTGAAIFRREDLVRSMYLVRSGSVALERALADGTALTLAVARSGMALAEASLFADTYHCDAVVHDAAEVAILSRVAFLTTLSNRPEIALGLIEAYAHTIQSQRTRIEILRMRKVSSRLDAWLDLNGAPPEGQWKRVAEDIGVSPPALYRELAKRRL